MIPKDIDETEFRERAIKRLKSGNVFEKYDKTVLDGMMRGRKLYIAMLYERENEKWESAHHGLTGE